MIKGSGLVVASVSILTTRWFGYKKGHDMIGNPARLVCVCVDGWRMVHRLEVQLMDWER